MNWNDGDNGFNSPEHIKFSNMIVEAIYFAETHSVKWETILVTGAHHLVHSSCGASRGNVWDVACIIMHVLMTSMNRRTSDAERNSVRKNTSVILSCGKAFENQKNATMSVVLEQVLDRLENLNFSTRWH